MQPVVRLVSNGRMCDHNGRSQRKEKIGLTSKDFRANIGGFRDTYLGRQVVSRPGGPRAGIGSAGGLGERCELP